MRRRRRSKIKNGDTEVTIYTNRKIKKGTIKWDNEEEEEEEEVEKENVGRGGETRGRNDKTREGNRD